MDKTYSFLALLLIIALLINLNCKKEKSCESCHEGNKAPIAAAGPDQDISLPLDSILLDGSSSSDPDGSITKWLWKKISGPSSFTIRSEITAKTVVNNLSAGTYRFELKVTDNKGLTAMDTIQVTVINLVQPNRPPIARAGSDRVIQLPNNTVTIDGSSSTDPDNNISNYSWRNISGPNNFSIATPLNASTAVTLIEVGIYAFELKVTDSANLSSTDTIKITVLSATDQLCNPFRPKINAQLTQIGTLSQLRGWIAVATAGDKILFAGGVIPYGNTGLGLISQSTVDIYNTSTNTWAVSSLSEARHDIGVIAVGNKIFFAGGEKSEAGLPVSYSSTVDIYDITTDSWSVSNLSEPRSLIACASVGNKVLFAGGQINDSYHPSNRVDIYDLNTQTWSTAQISEPRSNISAVTLNNKAYFAGGDNNGLVSNTINIYDNTAATWSLSSLQEARTQFSAVAAGNKIFWAGGWNSSGWTCSVEIFDVASGTTTINYLYAEKFWLYDARQHVPVKNNKILFPQSINLFDMNVYDLNTNLWSICEFTDQYHGQAIINPNDNQIYYISEYGNNMQTCKVYILDY